MTQIQGGVYMSRSKNKLKNDFQDKEYAHAYVNEFLNTSIATQIKVLREQRDLTQKQLALKADMKQSRISLLENVFYDKWSILILKKLAEAFDVTLKVSFEEFSDRITDMQNLDRKSFERLSRIDDFSLAEQPEKGNEASSSHLKLVGNNSSTGTKTVNISMASSQSRTDSTIPAARSDKETERIAV